MRRTLFLGGGFVLALAVGLLLPALGLPLALSPDLVLIGVVLLATRSPSAAVLVGAWAAGFVLGSFGAVPAGAAACGKLVAAFAAVRLAQIVDTRGRPLLVALIFASALLDGLVSSGVAWFLGVRLAPIPGDWLSGALATALAAQLLFLLSDWYQGPSPCYSGAFRVVSFHEDLRSLNARVGRLRWLSIAMLVIFALVLFRMQVLRSAYWRAQAENNHLKRQEVAAERGLLRDRSGKLLVGNRPAYRAQLLPDRGSTREAALTSAAQLLDLSSETITRARKQLRDPFQSSLTLAEDIGLETVSAIEARRLEMPELEVREVLVRYPHGALAAHALGHVGEIQEDQLRGAADEGYAQGDIIGQSGLEGRYERWLRGRDGSRLVVVDSRGREVRVLARDQRGEPGHDLELTLDVDVQRAGEAAFGAYRGAAVLMDVRTGAVRAFISRPSYDPNAFAWGVSASAWKAYTSDQAHPLFNRPLKGRTAPGSVFKIVATIAALEGGHVNPLEQVSCGGWTVLHRETFRCWRAGGHGPVDLEHAIEKSCNVYFYRLGDAMGIDTLAAYSRKLGLDQRTGIDLDGETRGVVPDPRWKRQQFGERWWPGETVSVSIGQGALAVSVLEVASMLAQVAHDGVAMRPYLMQGVWQDGREVERQLPQVQRQLTLRPSTLSRLRAALCAVVNRKGTAGRARIEGYQVCGKTGTAQVRGRETEGRSPKEHAWFAGYAPGWDPRFAVAVLVEHGGHGGETAAPVARVLLEEALSAEGIPPRLDELPTGLESLAAALGPVP